jgi:hypothetical protein
LPYALFSEIKNNKTVKRNGKKEGTKHDKHKIEENALNAGMLSLLLSPLSLSLIECCLERKKKIFLEGCYAEKFYCSLFTFCTCVKIDFTQKKKKE